MLKKYRITVDEDEHATILAALRFYQEHGQGEPANRSDAIHEIATCCGEQISLDEGGIDDLCEKLNCEVEEVAVAKDSSVAPWDEATKRRISK